MNEKHSPRLVKHKASKVLIFHDKKHIEKEADNYVKLTNQWNKQTNCYIWNLFLFWLFFFLFFFLSL